MDPEVPRPEERIQVTDVEDPGQAEAADERDACNENGERGPERSTGRQTAQVKVREELWHARVASFRAQPAAG
jgi:hypothetical protein